MKSATLRNIFAIVGCGLVTTVAASGILFYDAFYEMKAKSIHELELVAQSTALTIQDSLAAPIKLVDTLDTTLQTAKAGGRSDRAATNALLKTLLQSNPGILATWTAWEPGMFDGKDKDFIGQDGHDQTGRFVPYWFRSGSEVKLTPLVDYTVPGAGDYYLKPFTEKRAVVIEPYVYSVDGKEVLMTSITKPILIDGKTVGVAGLDLLLADTRAYLDSIHPMGDGWVGLVTASGNIVGHRNPALAGKSLKDMGAPGQDWAQLIAKPTLSRNVSTETGESSFAVAYPVHLGGDNVWYAVASVPEATLFAQLRAMAIKSLLIVASAALLLSLVGWLIVRKFVSRINNVIAETNAIASGTLDLEIKDRSVQDEFGNLARSLDILLQNNRRKVELENQAEISRRQQEQERDERARIAAAQEADVRFAVTALGGALNRLAGGDMTVRLTSPFTSALETIRDNFNSSVEKLEEVLLASSEHAQAINSGSNEIGVAANDLARRTEQQAASVEETAAALEEITTSVSDSARRAQEAGSFIDKTRGGAERSGQVVRQAIEAMRQIETSSESISNIIGVIDEIAFQTNLLALNAGVEAARAGEAGKGFAVVAQEVRELAQRSASAAKEIKTLISTSGAQVKAGVTLVDQTGVELDAIAAGVQEINGNIQAIAKATREQANGLAEINSAVNRIDAATQQNAGMVEETNAATQALASEVGALTERLGHFKLGRTSHAASPLHAAAARMRA
ncbi:methyl-accepting chemotaxis protein [Xaviernesmea oryzae]|uniref:methyl-accepting chemotaxis protein n=1 Tax=Xaviernesmea oryzae TaxID=464029 RepID=UPI0008BF8A36|nr:methyl-accepting chemotaxis protein [Xaviernesmea oryzae]SEL00855.1 methyl-accepting chemotaxis sensory transducer with Cache sensor [Xaviernesmea oryzae]